MTTVEDAKVSTVDNDGITFRSEMTVELVKANASDADVLFAARVSTKGEQSLEDVNADAERSAVLLYDPARRRIAAVGLAEQHARQLANILLWPVAARCHMVEDALDVGQPKEFEHARAERCGRIDAQLSAVDRAQRFPA